ncbi:hypothetical protein H0H81_010522 [Sphagnurus paluster]|uniref:DH domain-containing protein n=1 Tax=Sphagnurus paluster TaxID=117069 RepID=A0A9P7FVM7_9AGAR|nr:hypothetical protein H0H81_010522 [Sphagnurus paluster]
MTPPPSNPASSSQHPNQRFRRPATPPPLEIDDVASIVDEIIPYSFQMRHQSLPTHTGLSLDDSNTGGDRSTAKDFTRPQSPAVLSMDDAATSSSGSSLAPSQHTPMTKRQHALHELLSSERAYASDLALIREVHIPLALGQHVPLSNIPISIPPPLSSSSSSRTVSMSSDSSSASIDPPMTQEDARIIFSNIPELAMFSDQLCEGLEDALGSALEGGEGEDRVGALFLDIIPELEKPYKYYINRHPTALAHLQALPQTPALAAYLQRTQSIASSLSHAWDLASLLIKPVQRLLKYSLLLAAIIDETSDAHGDKENLKLARVKMEEVARNVNEGRRRAEVVKEVLTAKKSLKSVNVGVAASVNLTKMKSISRGHGRGAKEENGEAALVAEMQAELKRIDVFTQQFAKNVVEWAKMTTNVVLALRTWALKFGRVIGLSEEAGSEAFDAFLMLVEKQLVPLCHMLEAEVNEHLLREIAHLLKTMTQPLKLLESMNEQEPFHYHLLNMNVSAKNRPPPSLLAASTNYLALRGQLAAELPTYLTLFHKGLAALVVRLTRIQTAFWNATRERWAELWEMLRVEGEMNAGHEETLTVWHMRWSNIDQKLATLNITQRRKLYVEPPPRYTVAPHYGYAADSARSPQGRGARAPSVLNALSSLEPVHVVGPYIVSSPQALAPRGRPRGNSDAASAAPAFSRKMSVRRKGSEENMVPSVKSTNTVRKGSVGFMEFMTGGPRHKSPGREQQQAPMPRTKSMPLPPQERVVSYRSSASSKTLVDGDTSTLRYSQEMPILEDDLRGRAPSKPPSLRRKSATESIRPNSSSSSTRQRSVSKSARSSATSFFDDFDAPFPPPLPPQHRDQERERERGRDRERDQPRHRDSWVSKRTKYMCKVVHACQPPATVSYYSFPFFTLVKGGKLQVLHEAGHPSLHPKLPLYVDDGEDCLLLCRDKQGDVGWALASFLAPIEEMVFS